MPRAQSARGHAIQEQSLLLDRSLQNLGVLCVESFDANFYRVLS